MRTTSSMLLAVCRARLPAKSGGNGLFFFYGIRHIFMGRPENWDALSSPRPKKYYPRADFQGNPLL